MEPAQKTYKPFYKRKWPWITLAILVFVFAFIRLSLKAEWVHNIVKIEVERAVSTQTGAVFKIGHMEGDLLKELSLTDIKFAYDEPLLTIDSLFVSYNIWGLLSSQLEIEKLHVFNPSALIEQKTDSVWNFTPLIALGAGTEAETDDASGGFDILIPDIKLTNGAIFVNSEMLPDGKISAEDTNLEMSFSSISEILNIQLHALSFNLKEGRLPQPIAVSARAEMEDQKITLEQLLAETGRTALKATSSVDLSEELLSTEINIDPISPKDLSLYIDGLPAFDSASLQLTIDGEFRNAELITHLTARDIFGITFIAGFGILPEPLLRQFTVEITEFRVNDLTDDLRFEATIGAVTLEGDGLVYLSQLEKGALSGKLTVEESIIDGIGLDGVAGDFKWSSSDFEFDAVLRFPGQSIESRLVASEIFDFEKNMAWDLNTNFRNLNAGYFLLDDELNTDISGRLALSGNGIEPGTKPWVINLKSENPRFDKYQFNSMEFNALITAEKLIGSFFTNKNEASVQSEFALLQWKSDIPEWSASLEVVKLNLEQLALIDGLDTDLNFTADITGSGADLKTLKAEVFILMNPSAILGESVDSAMVSLAIEDTILDIQDAFFESDIVRGVALGKIHTTDFSQPDNYLEYELQILNIESFAPLAGLERLEVDGTFSGIMRYKDELVILENIFQLESLIADDLAVNSISGNVDILFKNEPEITFNLAASESRYDTFELKKMEFITELIIGEANILGNAKLDFTIDDQYSYSQSSNFNIAENVYEILTSDITVRDRNYEINLLEPFRIDITDNLAVKMDTLKLRSTLDANIDFHFSRTAESKNTVFLESQLINVGALQRTFLNETIAEGLFSGTVFASFKDSDDLKVKLTSKLEEIDYNGLEFNLANLNLSIDSGFLSSDFNLHRNDTLFVDAEFKVPFSPGDPETFTEAFFEQNVEGFGEIKPIQLENFEQFYRNMGLPSIKGLVSGRLDLSGKAGSPDLQTNLILTNAELSGARIDSLGLRMWYEHDNGRMHMDSEMLSLGQRALNINGSVPFYIDWRSFAISELEEYDEIDLNLQTTAFDVSVFNEFLDRDVARNLRGRINSDIAVGGKMKEPTLTGTFEFTDGRVFLVENNITLRNMRANLTFEPDRIVLERLNAESVGSLSASGFINLDGLSIEDFELSANGQRFRVSHTRDLEVLTTFRTRLSGTLDEPKLTGDILLDRGFIYLDNFGDTPIEQVVLEDEIDYTTFFEDLYERFDVEMILRIDRRFYIRNRSRPELELELEGVLDAVKEPFRELELFGDINVVRGRATQLSRRFILDEGSVVFSGPPDNPELDIRLKYELRREADITIWYVIRGDLQDDNIFSYESEPEMELQDIISYTLFGRPFNSLSGWEQGVSGGATGGAVVADAALDLLIERLESLTAERLGIDVLEIDYSSSGTSIKAGKFFGDRLFVALVQELSSDPTSQVIIEYLLRRNLELIFTGSDDYRTGIDILWRLDY